MMNAFQLDFVDDFPAKAKLIIHILPANNPDLILEAARNQMLFVR